MKKKIKYFCIAFALIATTYMSIAFLQTASIPVLQPKGIIAEKEKELLIIASLLMIIVVIPVCFFSFWNVWKYRASNKKIDYAPDYNHSIFAETLWWGIPTVIIAILSVITWYSTHDLDPFKPLESDQKPLRVQAVALQWKWLFIYPEEHIATVGYLQIPEKRPINFEITSDAPMNSLWIPQLGGMMYAMAGMDTKLHLIADEQGQFFGTSANISGKGFSGMTFTVDAVAQEAFDSWTKTVKQNGKKLDFASYQLLAKPSENEPVTLYDLEDDTLYRQIINKYMMP